MDSLFAVDPVVVRAGVAGERLLARARVWLFGALSLIPLSWALPGVATQFAPWEVRAGVIDCAGALVIAALIQMRAQRDRLPRWFGAASGMLDVSLVSLALVGFLVAGHPAAAVNSLVPFELYFLGIAASALRYDWRVCALATLAAMLEYLTIAIWAATHGASADAVVTGYAPFSWALVIGRTILLALAGVLVGMVAWRTGKLRIASVRDQLTGLTNRAYFDERLAEEWSRAARRGALVAALIVDVDHFKQVNDRFGHAAGDQVLQAVARSLRTHARETDVLARYGGEEFALLLVGADATAAQARAEALRAAIESVSVPLGDAGGAAEARVTVSVGVAHADEPAITSAVALIHTADARLYRAKGDGRNRVVGQLVDQRIASSAWPSA